jgi:peptidoglycan/LPS O-acetylase OafA/YrhL
MPVSTERIPSLDGIRAISIAMVLFAHLAGTRQFVGHDASYWIGDIGNLGVRVFFVISGYLITTLLMAELVRRNTISLSRFYFRRSLRIFPACYVFLGCVWIAAHMGWIRLLPGDLPAAITYTFNYHHPSAWEVGHLWSLAVEEQFYLLWPFILYSGGHKAAVIVALSCVIAAPIIRTFVWFLLPHSRPILASAFPAVADTLAIGCLLASARDRLGQQKWYTLTLGSPAAMAVIVAIMLLANYFNRSPRLWNSVGQTVANVAIALLIDACVRQGSSGFGRILNARPLVFVGVLSYSLYLWQQPFLNRNSDAMICAFPYNLVIAFAAAYVSYRLIEVPALAVRVRVEKRLWPRELTHSPLASQSRG